MSEYEFRIFERNLEPVWSDISSNFLPNPLTDDISRALNVKAVNQSIENIIFTSPGTRPFFPQFGVGINEYLFEQINFKTAAAIKDAIVLNIQNFEPRVELYEINMFEIENGLKIDIYYALKNSPTVLEVANFTFTKFR